MGMLMQFRQPRRITVDVMREFMRQRGVHDMFGQIRMSEQSVNQNPALLTAVEDGAESVPGRATEINLYGIALRTLAVIVGPKTK